MNENPARGYCQLYSTTPSVEMKNFPRSASSTGGAIAPPRDPHSVIYLAFILCGAGFLLPYNSFITAVDYYQEKYPDTTIIFDMSLTYICLAFLGVLANNLLVELFTLQSRITFGYAVAFVTLLSIALTDVGLQLFPNHVSYNMNLVAVAVVAIGCTVQQSSFYGYTSMLPRRYTQAVMTGESAAGLLVSLNRILTKALLENSRVNTIIFFAISLSILIFCFICFQLTRRTEFVRFYVSSCESAGLGDDQRGITTAQMTNPEEVSLVDILDGNVARDSYGVLVIQSPTTPTDDVTFPVVTPTDDVTANGLYAAPASAAIVTQQNEEQIRGQGQAYRKHMPLVAAVKRGCMLRYNAAKSVWPYMLSIGLAYFVSLSLFPGIESEVVSCKLHSWMPVILIASFNLFDFIGKIVASIPYDWPRGRLLVCTFCRIILVPLMMLCAAPRKSPFLQYEGWSIVLSILLGITNGYFGSIPMILAPGKVPDDQKELTGNIMTLSYSVGLTGGSIVAYLLDAWLGPRLTYDPCQLNATSYYMELINNTNFLHVLSDLSHMPQVSVMAGIS